MNDDAVFRASYSDWKPIKSRRVIQLVFEVPWEGHDEAYRALGGMPDPGQEQWFGIARLKAVGVPAGADKPKKSPAQIAGFLCTTVPFQKFLRERLPAQWANAVKFHRAHPELDDAPSEIAAECVRDICTVGSRSELTDKNIEWNALLLAFRLWENHPELEDA